MPIINRIAEFHPEMTAWRRDFHEHPELGNQEVRTAGIVAAHLRSLGIEVQEKVARTGVVGILKGGKPGPVVALRADMDGLPVTERVDLPFKSKVITEFNGQKTGVMHACGHDVHTTCLLGAARILHNLKNEWEGTVKLIFQPGEERNHSDEAFQLFRSAEHRRDEHDRRCRRLRGLGRERGVPDARATQRRPFGGHHPHR